METGNTFYQDFDLQRFPEPEASRAEADYRNAFQIERDRILFAYPFRRLQSKTQVFRSGEYDFYRTRLTHSIEVAKIGRSICEYLRSGSEYLNATFFIDPDLTEAISLAHDIGHPPFGHIGERKLNGLMGAHGGFEGNAQTLRIVTEIIYERPDGKTKGIAPTRAFLDGVMKYKALRRERTTDEDPKPEHHFLYDEQAVWRDIVFDGAAVPIELSSPDALNGLKSVECQIMDWADDTAYSLHDIVDGIHARYLTVSSIMEWARNRKLDQADEDRIDKLCRMIRENAYERYLSSRIGKFVRGCALKRRDGFLADRTHRHAFDLKVDSEIKAECRLYKDLAVDRVFNSTQLQQIEFKGGHILEHLFQAFLENCLDSPDKGLRILPPAVQKRIAGEADELSRYRRLCDYTAGLTDGQAMRTYKRLFDPDFGSISELL